MVTALLLAALGGSPGTQLRDTEPEPLRQDPIVIGVIGPFTGPSGFVGPQELNGVQLAVAEVNDEGGIHGRRVEVIHEDDRGWPERSEMGVATLIRKGAVAIIGPNNSSCTLVDMQVAAYYNVPLLTADATATRITSMGNRWVFRCVESDYFRLAALSQYLVDELQVERIGVLYEDDEYGRGLRTDLEDTLRRYEMGIAYSHSFQRGHKDFSAALHEAEEQGVQALGLFGITSDNLRIASQCSRLGYDFQLFAPGVNERYIAPDTEGVTGMISTDSFYVHRDKKSVRDFIARYQASFGEEPGPIAARSYDAARILLNAMRRVRLPYGEYLRDALYATENFPGLTGNFNFKSNGDVIKEVGVIVVQDGRFLPARQLLEERRERLWTIITGVSILAVVLLGSWGWVLTRRLVRLRRKKRALERYTPITVNPYIVGNPVREENMFFGRQDDFDFIRKHLEHETAGVCLVICGERRSGKTSVLYQILNGRLGEGYFPTLIDFQLYGNVRDMDEFFQIMVRDIIESLRRRDLATPEEDLPAGFRAFEAILDFLIRTHPDRKILLLLDEYEIMENLVRQDILHPSVIGLLAGLLERHPALNYVLTGSTRLEDRDGAIWQHLIAKSIYRKISYLTQRDTCRLIEEPLAGLVYYEAGVPERIYRLTAGQPFFTQAICMNCVDHLNEVRRNVVNEADLDEVLEQMVENPLPQILYMWENFTPAEKLVLAVLADAVTAHNVPGEGPAEVMAHVAALQLPVTLDHETVMTTLENLCSREVLLKRGGDYHYRMDLLRIWVQREHSPWQILGESRNGLAP